MKILFINTYYPRYLSSFYKKNKDEVKGQNYNDHLQTLLNDLFGDSDFYSRGMQANNQDARDIIVNDETLQKKWVKEKGLRPFSTFKILSRIKYVRIFYKPNWFNQILMAQINEYKPDVLYFQTVEYFSPSFLKKLKKISGAKIIAQKASPIGSMSCYKATDLIFTSFPHFLPIYKKHNINAVYMPLAFGERVNILIPDQETKFNCTFIGGISRHHKKGINLLTKLSEKVQVDFFGYGKNELDKHSAIYKNHHGEIWGKEMYERFKQSKMTINRHIDVAEDNANNMRLFEATGSGTMLITDEKKNLHELFEIDKEIVTYKDINDLIEKIEYYSKHDEERKQIANAGKKRTLKDHNYTVRMKQILEEIKKLY